ncbi:MAG: DUF5655 domain-containing protein [Clostridia bacterium]|nr:DUF5655 domain-containing protein [Clostridia bacterium]
MEMNVELLSFFAKMPEAFPLYEAVAARVCGALANVGVQVKKTQISFVNKHLFACVSLPFRRMKDRPDVYIILTFGLNHRVEHPRIAQSTEPYPGRWTHHVLIQSEDEIDEQMMEWVCEAYHFAMIK